MIKRAFAVVMVAAVLACAGVFIAGSYLMRPVPATIGAPPRDLDARDVNILAIDTHHGLAL